MIKLPCNTRKIAYLGLGSNLQNPLIQVQNAINILSKNPSITLVSRSSLYLTKPVGYLNQPDYINAVIKIQTSFSAQELLKIALMIEETFGRKRSFRNAPRVLDIDILWYQDVICYEDHLTLPHPRLFERAFVLVPLAEIAPNLFIFPHGYVKSLLARVKCDDVKQLNL